MTGGTVPLSSEVAEGLRQEADAPEYAPPRVVESTAEPASTATLDALAPPEPPTKEELEELAMHSGLARDDWEGQVDAELGELGAVDREWTVDERRRIAAMMARGGS
jgi:hypothetical protein